MMDKKQSDFGPVFWVHLLSLVLIYTSPLWISWQVILAGIPVWYFVIFVFKGCPLIRMESGEVNESNSFCWHYLSKIGFQLNQKKMDNFVVYFIPLILLVFAFIWQVIL